MMVTKPKLCDNKMYPVRTLEPIRCSLELSMEDTNKATLVLDDTETVGLHDWVEIFTQNGSAGKFRVTSVKHEYTKQIELTLLHGIDILADQIYPEEKEFTGTPVDFLNDLLSKQTSKVSGTNYWVLGETGFSATATYNATISYNTLRDLLFNFVDYYKTIYLEFDQSSFPWVINVRFKQVADDPLDPIDSEFRLSRNINSCSVSMDDSDMCTRVYLTVNGNVVWNYNDADAQAKYGIIAKHWSINTADYPSPETYARWILKEKTKPHAQITIDGYELSKITGSTFDELKLGRLCRVALPDYGDEFIEHVSKISYPDLLGTPDHVVVELAHTAPTLAIYGRRNILEYPF